jgi:hypothetical protein
VIWLVSAHPAILRKVKANLASGTARGSFKMQSGSTGRTEVLGVIHGV